jgi:hypothetical protein
LIGTFPLPGFETAADIIRRRFIFGGDSFTEIRHQVQSSSPSLESVSRHWRQRDSFLPPR